MALIKNIKLENGVSTQYHRVCSITNITNSATIIEVASYTSKEKRLEEKEALENGTKMNVFINTQYLNLPYDDNMNITSAYEYLKTVQEFKSAKDDI
jgi:hypothetical protein